MIEAYDLTKRYGAKTAVEELSFQVRPGSVTGFLGPNGSGKSTTMRLMLGLDAPTSGTVTIDGRPFRQTPGAAYKVGALLDAKATHGGRNARNHLLSLARLAGLPKRRVDEVLDIVGLENVAGDRTKGFSLGMGQRLGIAAALLGDPEVLLFDEPVNGLDPEGIHWMRKLMRQLASQGRTVFVSSHLMSEMELTADHLIVIGQGRLLADMTVRDFIDGNSVRFARLRTADDEGEQRELLAKALNDAGGRTEPERDGALKVTGLDLGRIGDLAYEHGIRLHELSPHHASLEEAYMRLTQEAVEYRSQMPGVVPAGSPAPSHPAPAPVTSEPQRTPPGRPTDGRTRKAGLRSALASEWTKIRSVRSTVWALLLMTASIAGLGGVAAVYFNNVTRRGENLLGLGTSGFLLSQVGAIVLGVTTITSEYGTGMIRATLVVCPRRARVMTAKALVLCTLIFTVGGAAVGLFALLAVAVLGDEAGSPTAQAMSRAVFGGGLYLTLIGLMSFAFGALLRNSAAAITTMLGIVMVPAIVGVFAGGLFGMERLGTVAIHYSPMNIAASLFRVGHDPETNSLHLMAMLAVATAMVTAAAYIVVATRDV